MKKKFNDTAGSTSNSSKNKLSSVNNDCENWIKLQGKKNVAEVDVRDLGKVVGVKYHCETKNSFNFLTREGRREWRAAGGGEVVQGEDGVMEKEGGVCWLRRGWWVYVGWVVTMKVLSYNVRGLGGGEKRVEVRRLVQEKQPLGWCFVFKSQSWWWSRIGWLNRCGGLPHADFCFNHQWGPKVVC